MTPIEAGLAIDSIARDVMARVLGVGASQYSSDEGQKFESMPLEDLISWTEEEALDIIAYGSMLTIRLRRLKAVVLKLEARTPSGGLSLADSIREMESTVSE